MTKRTIPQIRQLIAELTSESVALAKRQTKIAKEIAKLAEETTRRSPVRRAPRVQNKLTEAIKASIVKMAVANPDTPLREIAAHFDIDAGRVSELLAGRRG